MEEHVGASLERFLCRRCSKVMYSPTSHPLSQQATMFNILCITCYLDFEWNGLLLIEEGQQIWRRCLDAYMSTVDLAGLLSSVT